MLTVRENTRRWRKANPEKYRAQQQRARANLKAKRFLYVLRVSRANARRCGYEPIHATEETLEATLAEQDGCCAICGSPDGEVRRERLVPDHDHATGQLRGWLCMKCNTGVGLVEHTVERVAAYLKRN